MKFLQKDKRWIVWQYLSSRKIPYDPETLKPCSGDYYDTAGVTYAEAERIAQHNSFNGVGLIIKPPIIGIDLDHCFDEAGQLLPQARRVVETISSYTELSPSGEGLHILVKGDADITLGAAGAPKGYHVEIYTQRRYFTFTGKVFEGRVTINGGYDKEIQALRVVELESRSKQQPKGEDPEEWSGSRQQAPEEVQEGGRNDYLYKRAFAYCVNNALSPTLSEAELAEYCQQINNRFPVPLEDPEVLTITRRAAQLIKAGRAAANVEQAVRAFGADEFATPELQPLSESKGTATAARVIDQFTKRLKKSPADELQSIGSYKLSFDTFVESNTARISTGIQDLDIALCGGLSNELYVIGAESGQGKSALSMQIAQNVAAAGNDVLYFALEMSKKELIARGISALSFTMKAPQRVTAGDILSFTYDPAAGSFNRLSPKTYQEQQAEYFKRYGEHLYIIENTIEGLNMSHINNYVTAFKEAKGHDPIVFVDYLQMIKADESDKTQQISIKAKVDNAIRALKKLSANTPVWVVSSVNRASYEKRIDLAAFKESGDIEYTAGVVLGLNLEYKPVYENKKYNADRTKEVMKKAAQAPERDMLLEVLKYRNGQRNKKVSLTYYAKYNCFMSDIEVAFDDEFDE